MKLSIDGFKVLKALQFSFEDNAGVNYPKTTKELSKETGVGRNAPCSCKRNFAVRKAIQELRREGFPFFCGSFEQQLIHITTGQIKKKIKKWAWYIPTQPDTIKSILNRGKSVRKGVDENYISLIKKLDEEIQEKGAVKVIQERKKLIKEALEAQAA
jgi:hypothetical protein